ncbi:hypothetical protein MN608_01581 [Microdochium nivale]|nr:hypothetical protein MN608_01581 [Microdochium nivale]
MLSHAQIAQGLYPPLGSQLKSNKLDFDSNVMNMVGPRTIAKGQPTFNDLNKQLRCPRPATTFELGFSYVDTNRVIILGMIRQLGSRPHRSSWRPPPVLALASPILGASEPTLQDPLWLQTSDQSFGTSTLRRRKPTPSVSILYFPLPA